MYQHFNSSCCINVCCFQARLVSFMVLVHTECSLCQFHALLLLHLKMIVLCWKFCNIKGRFDLDSKLLYSTGIARMLIN